MPIEIVEPSAGLPFGPGFRIQVGLVGQPAMPPGTFWQVSIIDLLNENLHWYTETQEYGGNDAWTFGFSAPSTMLNWSGRSQLPHGKEARLLVELVGEGVTEPSLSQPITYDTQTGMPYIATNAATQAQGGLTTEQAAQLEDTATIVQMGVGAPFEDVVGDLLQTVGTFASAKELIVPDLSGIGSLRRPGTIQPFVPGVTAIGLYWEVLEYPPELGLDYSATRKAEIDVLELATWVRDDVGLLYPAEVKDFKNMDGSWTWGLTWPEQISYAILPGVTVRAWWQTIGGFP